MTLEKQARSRRCYDLRHEFQDLAISFVRYLRDSIVYGKSVCLERVSTLWLFCCAFISAFFFFYSKYAFNLKKLNEQIVKSTITLGGEILYCLCA